MATTPASVLDYPDFALTYTDSRSFVIYDNFVTKTIAAYRDADGVAQSLRIGATSNLELEGAAGVHVHVGQGGEGFGIYSSVYDNNTRTDTQILNVDATAGATLITATAADRELVVSSADAENTVQVSSLIFTQCQNTAYLRTDQSGGIYIDEPVRVTRNLFVNGLTEAYSLQVDSNATVAGNVTAYGGVFAQNLNVWRQGNSNTIGYTFRINEDDQLELVKYGNFANAPIVTKHVLVFGRTPVRESDTSDTPAVDAGGLGGIGTVSLDGSGVTKASLWAQSPNGSLFVSGGQRVGVGLENPATAFQVVGGATADTVDAARITAQEILTTSDARVKDVTSPALEDDVLGRFDQLDVVRFRFRDVADSRDRAGILAQDVARLFPDAIVTPGGAGGDVMSVDNATMLAYVFKAIKEVSARLPPRV